MSGRREVVRYAAAVSPHRQAASAPQRSAEHRQAGLLEVVGRQRVAEARPESEPLSAERQRAEFPELALRQRAVAFEQAERRPAVVPESVHFSAATATATAAVEARRWAEPVVSATQAEALQPAELAAQYVVAASVAVRRAVAAWVVPRAVWRAAAEPLPEGAEAWGVAAGLQPAAAVAPAGEAAARRRAAVERDAAVVRQPEARAVVAAVLLREAPGVRAAGLPLAAALSAFRRDRVLRVLARQPAVRSARAMKLPPIASPSGRWWRAARGEALS